MVFFEAEWPGFEPRTSSIRRGRSIHSATPHLASPSLDNISFQISIPCKSQKIHSQFFPRNSHSHSRISIFSSELSFSFLTLKIFLEKSHSRSQVNVLSQKSYYALIIRDQLFLNGLSRQKLKSEVEKRGLKCAVKIQPIIFRSSLLSKCQKVQSMRIG